MEKRIIMIVSVSLILASLAVMSCDISGNQKAELTLSLTDAPAEADFEKILIDFGEVMVSQSNSEAEGEDEDEWFTINSDPGEIDLLTLTNGLTAELGTIELEPGEYNQIRIYVDSATVTVDGTDYPATVNSGAIKLVRAFTLYEGIETLLVADFDAAKSVKLTGNGQYRLNPVVKLQQVDLVGEIAGNVTPIDGVLITVSAFEDYTGDDTAETAAGTVCDENGDYKLGFLPPGAYDILIEADGYEDELIEDVEVTVGEATTLISVELTPTTP